MTLKTIHIGALFDELEKIAVGGLPAGLSMGGLAGLTGLEAHGAMDKKKEKKERLKSGLGAAATGSILAGEAIANKDMLKSGLEHAKKFFKGPGSAIVKRGV